MRPLLFGLLLLLVATVTAMGQKTTFIGVGPVYTLPLDTFGITNDNAIGGTLLYESRKYCQIWFGARLSYSAHRAKDQTLRVFYEDEVILAPEARYFPVEPMKFPLYVIGNLQMSSISGTDSAAKAGLGGGGGLGYLLMYDNDCCNWFLDFSARYQAPNLFLRSDRRPTLTSIVLALTFNISL